MNKIRDITYLVSGMSHQESFMLYFAENLLFTFNLGRAAVLLSSSEQAPPGKYFPSFGGFLKWGCPNSWIIYFMENPSMKWMI